MSETGERSEIIVEKKSGTRYLKDYESQLAAGRMQGLERDSEVFSSQAPVVAAIHQRFAKPNQTILKLNRIEMLPEHLVDILYYEYRVTRGKTVEDAAANAVQQTHHYLESNWRTLAKKYGLTKQEIQNYLQRSKLGAYVLRASSENEESSMSDRTLANGVKSETIRTGAVPKGNQPRAQDRHASVVVQYTSIDGNVYEIDISHPGAEKTIRLEDGRTHTVSAGRSAVMVHTFAEMAKGGSPMTVYAAIGDLVRSGTTGLDADKVGVMDNQGNMVLLFKNVFATEQPADDAGAAEATSFTL